MKKAAAICLISLTLCLSQAASPPDLHEKISAAATPDTKSQNKTTEIIVIQTTSVPPAHQETASKPAAKKTEPAEPSKAETAAPSKTEPPAPSKTEPPAPTKTEPSDNKTENKVETTAKPAEHMTEAAKTSDKPATEAKPVLPETSTPAVTAKPSEPPKDVTEKPFVKARGFDGPSFIGGIILTLGLLAIGFMGFKYYKNQTERNYHTL